MKFKQGFVNRFSKVVLSISVFVFCSSLLVFSINGASANNDTGFNFPDQLSNSELAALQSGSGGKYQMQLNTIVLSDDSAFWYILVWDSETGRSKLYYGNLDDGMHAAASKYQIPSLPL